MNGQVARTTKRSVLCDPWDVVVVPFPFVERRGAKRRPALVVSKRAFNEHGHSLLAMITTQTHAAWPGDVLLEGRVAAGLDFPCIVRLKLFTLDNRLLLRTIGTLAARDRDQVRAGISKYLFPNLAR